MSLPDEKQVERALNYLAESEEAYAQAVAKREAKEAGAKVARESAFLESSGSVAERQAMAGTSPEVRAALEALEAAYYDLEILRAKRQRALLVIEVFRTLEASRRRGVV